MSPALISCRLQYTEMKQAFIRCFSALTGSGTNFSSPSPPSGHKRKYPVFPDCRDVLRERYVPDLSQAVPGFV